MKRAYTAAIIVLIVLSLALSMTYTPTQAATGQSLTVDATTVINRIEHPFWGVNYVAFWDDIQGSNASRQALKNAGVQVIRFPGGEPANWMDFSKPAAPPYWTTTSISELQAYTEAIGARLLLQTNPTSNVINDTGEKNDPSGAHAAEVLRYVVQQGADVPYWEIGNEPDLHLSGAFDWNALQWYFDSFNAQAAAMKAERPGIKVFGPVGTNVWQWWGLGSLEMFLSKTGNKQGSGLVDGVSLHNYNYNNGQCAGWDQVRAFGQSWPANMAHIKSTIAAYDTRPLPVFISETNAAVSNLNCEINQTMASALANADLLGAYRDSGVQAVQIFGAIHGGNGWGLLYGSGDPRPADSATPTYYILPILTRTGNEVLKVTGAVDPSNTLSAYAARRADNSLQVIAINKSSSAIPLNIAFKGFNPAGGTVKIYELKPANGGIWDKDVLFNGVQSPSASASSLPAPASRAVTTATYSYTAPAYSLTLLDFSPGSGPTPTTPTTAPTAAPTAVPTSVPTVVPSGTTIRGRVTDPQGAPRSGITITTSTGKRATTGPDGGYTLSQLSSGALRLVATGDGYIFAPRSRKLTVPPSLDGVDFVAMKLRGTTPALVISHSLGKVGSEFALSCANFPPDATLAVSVNGRYIGTLRSDQGGQCGLTLATSNANTGRYRLTVALSQAMASLAALSASTSFTLTTGAPLLTQDGDDILFSLPAGIALEEIYLPSVQRNQ